MATFEPQPELSRCNSFISSPSVLSDAEVESCCHLYATQTNSRLLHVLSDLVKAFLDTENDIQKALDKMGFSSDETPSPAREEILPSLEDAIERLSYSETANDLCEDGPELITPTSTFCTSLALTPGVVSNLSPVSAEDDILLGASRRLRSAVKRILHLLQEIVVSHQQQESLMAKPPDDLLSETNPETEDLKAQIESTTKQISSFQKFLEQQAREREYERDQFNREVEKLEEKLKEKERMEFKLRDELEAHESQMAGLSEEKKELEVKVNEATHAVKKLSEASVEYKQIIAQVERENEEYVKTEKALKRKIGELEKTVDLQAHLHDEIHREHVHNSNSLASAVIENINLRTSQLQRTLNMGEIVDMSDFSASLSLSKTDVNWNNSTEDSSVDCSYADVNILDEKMKLLNSCIDKLVAQNVKLKSDLDYANSNLKNADVKFSVLLQEKVRLENQVREIKREEEILQEELSSKRLQLSTLKSRAEGNIGMDMLQLKQANEDLKKSLNREQHKNDNLKQQVAQLTILNEERNAKIQQLTEEIRAVSAAVASIKNNFKRVEQDKLRLTKREAELVNEKECLVIQESRFKKDIDQLTQENSELKAKVASLTAEKNEAVLPQLMQKVIKDKNEEIKCLSDKLLDLENKLISVLPDAGTHDVSALLEDLLDRLQLAESTSKSTETRDAATSPYITEEVDHSSNDHRIEINRYREQLSELHQVLNECQSENHLLRRSLHSLHEPRNKSFSEAALHRICSRDSLDPDIDLDEENLHDALETLHNNSRELLMLSESRRSYNSTMLRQVIESLPFAILGDLNGDGDGPSSEWRAQFLEHFPDQEIGILLFEKLQQINSVHNECNSKMKFYCHQYETVVARLAEVESELLEIQDRIGTYQENYDKLKDKCRSYETRLKDYEMTTTELEEKLLHYRANYKAAKEEARKCEKELLKSEQIRAGAANCNGEAQELYLKYKRCLSHKNALVYQKKYLLNVLGGFQLTEKATLALLANMNVTMEESSLSIKTAKTKFRTAVLAVMSISRMKFLVNRNACKYKLNGQATPKLQTQLPKLVHKTCVESSISSVSSSKSETNATLQEFVTRLHNLHQTLGLRSEAIVHESSSEDDLRNNLATRVKSKSYNGF